MSTDLCVTQTLTSAMTECLTRTDLPGPEQARMEFLRVGHADCGLPTLACAQDPAEAFVSSLFFACSCGRLQLAYCEVRMICMHTVDKSHVNLSCCLPVLTQSVLLTVT